MRTLILSDAELQKLVGDALRERLKAEGFNTGATNTAPCWVAVPVHLNLAGSLCVMQTEEGWIFRQVTDDKVEERVQISAHYHHQAVGRMMESL